MPPEPRRQRPAAPRRAKREASGGDRPRVAGRVTAGTPHGARRTASWPWLWAPVAALAGVIYLVVHVALVGLVPGPVNVYLVQPVLWFYLALLAFLLWTYGIGGKPRLTASLVSLAILAGVFQIALLAIGGVLFGFGDSPYGHEPGVLLGNAVFVVSGLAGVEFSRACMVVALGRRHPTLALLGAALFFSVLSIPLSRFSSVAGPADLFRFSGETFLPTFSENLFASFLALVGGPIPALAYRVTLQAFEWLSPILPDLEWLIVAFLSTMAPAIGMLVVRSQLLPATEAAEAEPEEAGSSTAWLLVAAITVTVLFFNTGLLGYHPTLITGVSMRPTLETGDIVISKEFPAESIMAGDMIRFRTGSNTFVVHRVLEVQQVGTETHFVTRGDNNNVEDPPLPASRLEGKVVFVVPKVGWVAIGVRKLIEWVL